MQRPVEHELEWHRRVAGVLNQRLSWSSVEALSQLLESGVEKIEGVPSVEFQALRVETECSTRFDWEITGGCHYGSHIRGDKRSLMVASCGGHWVAAYRVGNDGVRFMTDREPSLRSWGDALDEDEGLTREEAEALGYTDAEGPELEAFRVRRLEESYNKKLEAERQAERAGFEQYLKRRNRGSSAAPGM